MFAQYLERQPGSVFALAAEGTVKVGIIDVGEGAGIELGVVHVRTVKREGCGLLVYKSYSERAAPTLYAPDVAMRSERKLVFGTGVNPSLGPAGKTSCFARSRTPICVPTRAYNVNGVHRRSRGSCCRERCTIYSSFAGRANGAECVPMAVYLENGFKRVSTAKRVGLAFVFLWFFIGGVAHFVAISIEMRIVPPYIPWPRAAVLVSGVFELLGAIGILIRPTRRVAGLGLFLLTLAITPANVYMLQRSDLFTVPYWALVLRLPMQVALLALIAWSTGAASVLKRT
jgi:uncharacterized membrane protein